MFILYLFLIRQDTYPRKRYPKLVNRNIYTPSLWRSSRRCMIRRWSNNNNDFEEHMGVVLSACWKKRISVCSLTQVGTVIQINTHVFIKKFASRCIFDILREYCTFNVSTWIGYWFPVLCYIVIILTIKQDGNKLVWDPVLFSFLEVGHDLSWSQS